MKLPNYLKLAALLNAPGTHQQALNALASEGGERSSETLRALLPYLSLSTLLLLRQTHPDALGPVISERLYDLLDAQRDWVVSPECPTELRDSYLVRVFGEGWDKLVKEGMTAIAADKKAEIIKGLVLDSSKLTASTPQPQPCPDLATFQQKLKQTTGGLLEKLDWNNVVLGGGAVLSILTGKSEDEAYKNSDLDLFLVGLQPDELIPKVNSIIEQIQATLPPKPKRTKTVSEGRGKKARYRTREYRGELLIVKGFNAITLVPPCGSKPRRPIQIVLHNHATAFDALARFDLDACAVGYTGQAVVAVPRAIRSLSLGDWIGGVNFFDPKLGRKGDPSASTASSRALKYLSRGFSLALPPAAVQILKSAKLDLPEVLKKGKDRAKHDAQPRNIPDLSIPRTDELAGLAGLLRREANLERKLRDLADPSGSGLSLDYGLRDSSWLKSITEQDLESSENGLLAHDYWEYQIREGTGDRSSHGRGATQSRAALTDASYVYRVATIAGLWQFKGLDEDIDKALNLIWQAWSITARAAMSLPQHHEYFLLFRLDLCDVYEEARAQMDSGDTTHLAETIAKASKEEVALVINCLEQRTTAEALEQMKSDFAGLEQTIEALKSSPIAGQTRVGEWDEQRKRFLLEWMSDKEMI